MNTAVKNLIFWGVMAVTALLIWAVVKSSSSQPIPNLTFTQFSHEIAQDNVREVTITAPGNAGIFKVHGVLKKGNTAFETAAPATYTDWLKALTEKNVSLTFDVSDSNGWVTWLSNLLPLVLVLALWIFFMRGMRKGWRPYIKPPSGPENS